MNAKLGGSERKGGGPGTTEAFCRPLKVVTANGKKRRSVLVFCPF